MVSKREPIKKRLMANGWTPERRARQSELIRQWRPWEKSTGPKTEAGKAVASKNATLFKGKDKRILRGLYLISSKRDLSNCDL